MELLEQRIRGILAKYLGNPEAVTRCSITVNLRTLGLASMQFMSVMLDLERELSISIPNCAMTPNNFETIEAIIRTVVSLRPAIQHS